MSKELKELEAKFKSIKEANEKIVREKAQAARLTAALKLEENPQLLQARVRLQMENDNTEALQNLINECMGIIESMPIHSSKTRANREWAGKKRHYHYGTQINLLIELVTGIMYATAEHRNLMLAHTGLNMNVIDQLVRGLGAPAYYSRNYNVIVEAKPFNAQLVMDAVNVIQSQLGIVIDTTNLDPNMLQIEFDEAQTRAEIMANEAAEAMSAAELTM